MVKITVSIYRAGVALSALLLACLPAQAARIHRDHHVLAEFQQLVPCPSTGRTSGACPGFVKDHRIPLCLAPWADEIWNLQWQAKGEAAAKDKREWAACRALKRGG